MRMPIPIEMVKEMMMQVPTLTIPMNQRKRSHVLCQSALAPPVGNLADLFDQSSLTGLVMLRQGIFGHSAADPG